MIEIILHIPHSSTDIPSYDGYIVDKETIKNEVNLLTDWFTDDLFDLPYSKIITPFSRVFCDVERFHDDSKEIMSRYGMGMCYTHTDNGNLMRMISPELRDKIKFEFYDQHHTLLKQSISKSLTIFEKVVIIDCHSFPDIPLYRDLNKEMSRPDFCIGTDEYHTPDSIKQIVKDYLINKGFSVKFNNPYSGTMIPLKYSNKEKRVIGLMIEINRKLYMDIKKSVIVKSNNYLNIKNLINTLIINILNL
ncbi:MAG: N-formylglutamate amidohydrolase [Bacteroidetes bacterium ADurb.Bin145]|jgi:N-formylglutamate amidohydrolase|nr:MAG: N-formylglutamate amidohydrolase [Bacteroidetes bacterium ADurb.Bin145]